MKPTKKFVVVLVTAPDLKTGRKLARAALAARLVACANLMPRIESHYWWQGKIESSPEVLVVMKTATNRLAALEDLVMAQHPYNTPEFIMLPITRGNERYLAWLELAVESPLCRPG
jgi:periplasmic divalent cation tolerance protein